MNFIITILLHAGKAFVYIQHEGWLHVFVTHCIQDKVRRRVWEMTD